MLVKSEMHLASEFVFWAGACYAFENMTDAQISEVEETLTELYPDGMTDTEINDTFWFERDFLANCNGFDTWDEMMVFNSDN